jgi:hypothetical protein
MSYNGGRGWNRTTNLSIKSRMLCQLSYASVKRKGRMLGNIQEIGRSFPPHTQGKYNIISTRSFAVRDERNGAEKDESSRRRILERARKAEMFWA